MNSITIHTDNFEVVKLCDKEFLLANVVNQTKRPNRKYEVEIMDERSEASIRNTLHNIYESLGIKEA